VKVRSIAGIDKNCVRLGIDHQRCGLTRAWDRSHGTVDRPFDISGSPHSQAEIAVLDIPRRQIWFIRYDLDIRDCEIDDVAIR